MPAGCALSQGTVPRGRGCQQAQGTERETDVDSFGSFVQKPRGNVVGVIFGHVLLLLGTLLQRCVRHVAGQGNTQVAGQGNTQTSTQGTNTQTSTMPRTSRSSVGRRRSMGSSSSRPPVLFIARERGPAVKPCALAYLYEQCFLLPPSLLWAMLTRPRRQKKRHSCRHCSACCLRPAFSWFSSCS